MARDSCILVDGIVVHQFLDVPYDVIRLKGFEHHHRRASFKRFCHGPIAICTHCDNRDVREPRIPSQALDRINAIEVRHIDVREDTVRRLRGGIVEACSSVNRSGNRKLSLQKPGKKLSYFSAVIHDENPGSLFQKRLSVDAWRLRASGARQSGILLTLTVRAFPSRRFFAAHDMAPFRSQADGWH